MYDEYKRKLIIYTILFWLGIIFEIGLALSIYLVSLRFSFNQFEKETFALPIVILCWLFWFVIIYLGDKVNDYEESLVLIKEEN